jgi:hypothetical protein
LDDVSLKKIFQEVVYSTLGNEYMDINLATTTQRTYGNVIEDLVALILVAHCGVSVPEPPTGNNATNSKKDLIDSLAKNILTYEIAHIRKAYLEKLMWTIPAQDSSIYNKDYYQKYKYNICTAHPILSLKDYIQMRHHKKMQHYLCECSLSWSYFFTGEPEPPVEMEPSTILPEYRVQPVPRNIVYYVQSPSF